MGSNIDQKSILTFIKKVSDRYKAPGRVYLLGGSALTMLGNSRRTIDIDVYIEEKESDLKSTIEDTANELRIFVDVIPINEFTKIPGGAADRHIFLEKVGALEVVVFDPYTIAISKLSRGYADDISDVVFMIQKNYVQLEKLTQFVEETIPVAWDYDDDPEVLKNSLLIVEKTIK